MSLGDITKYNEIKRMKLIDILDYLDVEKKKNRIVEIKKQSDLTEEVIQDFKRPAPKKII